MSSLERFGIEGLAALLLCGGFWAWWALHDHTEQKIGAQKCIISTTLVKADVVTDNSDIETAHAAQLAKVVQTYESKLADSAGSNASLAKRLHDASLRQSAVRDPAGAACPSPPDRGLSESEGAALGRLQSDTAALLNACDADHAKVSVLNAAYNDWRNQMIAAGKTGDTVAPR